MRRTAVLFSNSRVQSPTSGIRWCCRTSSRRYGREVAKADARHTPATQTGNRRHARVIPAADMTLFHQLDQLAFRKRQMRHVQTREFGLLRARRHGQVFDQPIVERAVVFELEGT